jgi:aldose 1-epimerase
MLELKSKFLTGRVLPEVGGCLERLDLTLLDQTIRPVLVAPSTAATHAGDARQSAHFAMLPYVNRVRGNMLRCGDAVITMQSNTDEPLALHGAGWQGAWRVLSATADRCELGLDAPANYPFRFHARQTFTLSDDALLINLSVTNTSSHAIPNGSGSKGRLICRPIPYVFPQSFLSPIRGICRGSGGPIVTRVGTARRSSNSQFLGTAC